MMFAAFIMLILSLPGLISGSKISTVFEDMFGSTLYKWNDNRDEIVEYNTSQLLKGRKTIAVYYSASWCGPCKQFTPVLAQFYADMNKKGKKFEVIWVSRDNTEDEFVSYYQKMPWLAVTVNNLQKCLDATGTKFQVRGIPHLVILDGYDGTVYTLDGRSRVAQDQYGLEFPWRPRTPATLLKQIVPRSLQNLLQQQVAMVKQKLMLMFRGVLDSLLPSSIIKRIFASA